MAQDHRTNGLITYHRHGAAHFAEMGRLSGTSRLYGESDAARKQRMRDVRAKREFIKQHGVEKGTALWEAMVERHRRQFATAATPRST